MGYTFSSIDEKLKGQERGGGEESKICYQKFSFKIVFFSLPDIGSF